MARVDSNADNRARVPHTIGGLSVGCQRACCADCRVDTKIIGQAEYFFSDLVGSGGKQVSIDNRRSIKDIDQGTVHHPF